MSLIWWALVTGWGGVAVYAATDAVPEALIEGLSPTTIAANETHLYVASSGFGLETCGFDPSQSKAVLHRMNFDGSNATPLLSRCHSSISALVADASYLYFRDGDNTIKRMPVAGGALEVMANDVNNCCGLVMDDTHLYWAQRESGSNNNAIYRMAKGGGAVELVVLVPNGQNTYFIRALTVDHTHVYWVEGKTGVSTIDQPGIGAVQKAPKAGGAPQMLADAADGIEHPTSIDVDETHVYWSEWDTGRARRVAKGGGAVDSYPDTPTDLLGHFVAVNASDVYWVDSDVAYAGRLRRSAKGGGDIADIAIAILGAGRPLLTDTHVYWRQHGGVYRLPLGSGGVAVDFSIDAVEVTQAVQDMNNNVPLVAEKHALVRVYPRVDIYTGQIPQVQLRGYRDGVELADSPLRPMNPNVMVFEHGADRFSLGRTFNFKLPEHWRAGVVTLDAEINHDLGINELETGNNIYSVVANFTFKKPLCVEMVRVFTAGHTASVNDPGFHDIVDTLQASYPVPTVLIDPGGMIKRSFGQAYEFPEHTNLALSRVGWYRLWHNHNQWQTCGAAHFYGMVHPNAQSAGGIGYRPGWAAWGVMAVHSGSDTIAQNAPWYAPHGGSTLAHEIGHNKGRKHVDCGGPDDTDDDYPHNPCWMGSGVPGSHVGYHYFKETIIAPGTTGDLMSYGMSVDLPRWVSDYTYEAIYNQIPADAAAAGAMAGPGPGLDVSPAASMTLVEDLLAADMVMLVSALVTPTTATAEYDQLYVVPAGTIHESTLIDAALATPVNPAGEYALQLRDAGGALLAELRFDLPDSDAPAGMETDQKSFVIAMPFVAGTERVVLVQDAMDVAIREASATPPKVQVLEPNGGESYAGSMTIRWAAEDPDGDALSFMVQYSPDNGKTWRVVESDAYSLTLDITDVSHLPGTKGNSALVRVVANDGLHTDSDESDATFSLRMQPPHVHIQNPSEGEVVAWGDTLQLVGTAFDVEDGQVAASGFGWTMDGVLLGSGRELDVDGLAVGKHTVELSVVDSGKMFGRDMRTFYVQKQYCEDSHANLDLVFVVDNSNAMKPYLETFCQALPDLVDGLTDMGLNVRYEVFGVADGASGGLPLSCAPTTVQSQWAGGIDHPGDWGAAVSNVASRYGWLDGYSRVIVPVINQGPADGNPVQDPGADRDAVAQAIAAANFASVAVSPLLMPAADSMNFAANMQLAGELAEATDGVVMDFTDAELDFAVAVQDVQGQLSCTPDVNTGAPLDNDGTQEICLMGRHLLPGTTAGVGDSQKDDVPVRGTANAEGTVFCFAPPSEIEDGEHTIYVGRPGMDAQASSQLVIVTSEGTDDPGGNPDDDPADDPDDGQANSVYLPVMLR
ncbi:MAG: hypothetical protein WDZ49_06380 [Litorilinea sp.]